MSIIPSQKFRFLGGEVSPNMYNSADMDQYGRWFSKAENIRFDTLGAFRNRPGFVKIANTKVVNGYPIKLLSFSFSREENYLIEMGQGYFRFFKDGKPIHVSGIESNAIYEVSHDMEITPEDIKYAQSGDVLYIVNGINPIGTLTRKDTSGFNWSFEHFEFKDSCMPLQEENVDEEKTLSIQKYTATIKQCSINTNSNFYNSVVFTFDGNDIYTSDSDTKEQLVNGIANAIGNDYFVWEEDNKLRITAVDPEDNVPNFSLAYNSDIIEPVTFSTYASDSTGNFTTILSLGQNPTIIEEVHLVWKVTTSYGTHTRTYTAFDNRLSVNNPYPQSLYDCIGFGRTEFGETMRSEGINIEIDPDKLKYQISSSGPVGLIYNEVWITATGHQADVVEIESEETTVTSNNNYIVSSVGHDFFKNKKENDVFGINFEIDTESTTLDGSTQTAVDTVSNVIKTNGKFGFATTGAWKGEIVLEYSLDGNTNWKVFRTLTSLSSTNPHNDNTAGTVSADSDIVYMRIRITQALTHDNYALNAYLFGEKFSANSYYKIIHKTSDSEALCSCVKNNFNIGTGETLSNIISWREPAFNDTFGYPSTIGFYQNRLILGKEYMLYASKTNDFSDFYEPIALIASDPITMSLLSNKYNRIRNILTIRKFFAFTEEGEFGIDSTGALTQTDKNLRPISYHGSSDCTPILAGNLALFVDFSGRVVRLFQYSYETDSFEATDASVFLEQLLKNRTIVTTEYIKNTKEALFLDDLGTIWVFKLMPEQEIYAWSHWKYANNNCKITNIRVVPNGADEDLYIVVEDSVLNEKRIEKLTDNIFYDSSKIYESETFKTEWTTDFAQDTDIVVDVAGMSYKVEVGTNGLIKLPVSSKKIECHYVYKAVATLLSPTQHLTEDVHTTYNKKKPFKVHFCYQDSYGFKVGVEEDEKMLVRFNAGDRFETSDPSSGKREVLIPSKYDGSSRVSFVQERPYNMSINNVMIDMDYGGK